MEINEILGRFEKVYSTGNNQWQCLCPAHDDKSASLGIKLLPDSRVLVNCFAGCSAIDVLEFAGLSFDDIIPSRIGDLKPVKAAFNPYAVLKAISNETLLVAIAAMDIANGKELSEHDRARLMKATQILREAYAKCH